MGETKRKKRMEKTIELALAIALWWNWLRGVVPGYNYRVNLWVSSAFWRKMLTCSVCLPHHLGLALGAALFLSGHGAWYLMTGVFASVASACVDRWMNG